MSEAVAVASEVRMRNQRKRKRLDDVLDKLSNAR
jgi:hypothetical protein